MHSRNTAGLCSRSFLLDGSPALLSGPESEAVQGIGVWVGSEGTYHSWFAETPPDGTFDLYVLDGTRTIKIYVMEGGFWRHVGWYRHGGFATDRGGATTIEVDGSDVRGIEVRLPAAPADLPHARAPRVRGVVVGPDGAPVEGIGVWLRGESDGSHKLGRTAADGTFDIEHQSGTFRVRINIFRDGGWRRVGWYGETGFTLHEEQAIEIVSTAPTSLASRFGSSRESRARYSAPTEDRSRESPSGYGMSPPTAISSSGFPPTAHSTCFTGEGAFTLRVYIWKDEVWHQIGWYGETGFTLHEEQAIEIVVDGADVTGIEIRLPPRVTGTVLGPDGGTGRGSRPLAMG